MSPKVARSCGPEMSALAPLLGDKRTSAERVRNDAIDPNRASQGILRPTSRAFRISATRHGRRNRKRPPTEAAYVQFSLVDPIPYLKFISPAGLDYLKRNRYVLE
jgi:hypothetical protein